MSPTANLPLPPLAMRHLVGPTTDEAFDNPTGAPILPGIPLEAYRAVFDFGCGCGRLARQLAQQSPRPERYVGVDLHAGMIEWCRQNLEPAVPGFRFHHHDVFNHFFNPGTGNALWQRLRPSPRRSIAALPVEDAAFSLAIAWSVFTHLTEEQCVHYLRELARILAPGGTLYTTWFLFEKADFPFMSSNALYVSYVDPSAAVVFDREWVREQATGVGLTIDLVIPPAIKGFHWQLRFSKDPAAPAAPYPDDEAPRGLALPPSMPPDPDRIGLD